MPDFERLGDEDLSSEPYPTSLSTSSLSTRGIEALGLAAAEDPKEAEFCIDTLERLIEDLDRTEQLDRSRRLDELKRVFSDACHKLGFEHFAYHIVRSNGLGGNASRLPHIISDYPSSWVRHYFAERYLDEDPVVAQLLVERKPFLWSELDLPENLSRRQLRLFDEARDAGLPNGLTLPIHQGGEIAAVSLVVRGTQGATTAVLNRHRHLLYLVALHYHNIARRTLLENALTGESTRRRALLSPREREVLEWTAKGKTTWEISAMLGISYKSVEFHIEGAKRKLQVFNRTHAVAKAIMLNLLSFDEK